MSTGIRRVKQPARERPWPETIKVNHIPIPLPPNEEIVLDNETALWLCSHKRVLEGEVRLWWVEPGIEQELLTGFWCPPDAKLFLFSPDSIFCSLFVNDKLFWTRQDGFLP